jgi:sulfoxide reductase heme-binding subunit YedZ
LKRFAIKAALWAAGLAPLGWMLWRGLHGRLGANPIEAITHATGDWTLRLLLLTLAITPLRLLTGWNGVVRYRRLIGLFAFFYATLHLLTYVWLDKFFDFADILRDIGQRRFVTAGMLAYFVLVPLAATSTAAWIARLGGRRWRLLHRLAYVSAAAGVVHYFWLVKSDIRLPSLYGVVLVVLLLGRIRHRGGAL